MGTTLVNASLASFLLGLLVAIVLMRRTERHLTTTARADGYDAGYQAALDEIKERHKARGRKAAATRRQAAP